MRTQLKGRHTDRNLVCLPDRALSRMFDGFEEITAEQLPKVAAPIERDFANFEAIFKLRGEG